MDVCKTGNEKRETRASNGKRKNRNKTENHEKANWSLGHGDEEVNKRIKQKKNTFSLKIYFFVLVFFYFFIAFCRDDQFAFSWFSSSYYSTDPGLQLGDPAPLIGLSLWTCWNFIFWNKTDKGENEVTDTARF